MKRVYRSAGNDVWQIDNQYVIVDRDRRPRTKFLGKHDKHDSLESCIKICDILDRCDPNDPMSIFNVLEECQE